MSAVVDDTSTALVALAAECENDEAGAALHVMVVAVDDGAAAHADDRALLDDVDRKSPRAGTIAGRRAARATLAQLGRNDVVRRGPIGEPLWPQGISGSIAHDDDVAVCVIDARGRPIGIDVEPALPLPAEVVADVVRDDERAMVRGADGQVDLLRARALFCAKEAAYKACAPLDGVFLSFHDVRVTADGDGWRDDVVVWRLVTSTGRTLRARVCVAPRVMAICTIA